MKHGIAQFSSLGGLAATASLVSRPADNSKDEEPNVGTKAD